MKTGPIMTTSTAPKSANGSVKLSADVDYNVVLTKF
jgi:hypothetical protein